MTIPPGVGEELMHTADRRWFAVKKRVHLLAVALGVMVLGACLTGCSVRSHSAGLQVSSCPESARQLVVVRTADWQAVTGTLQRYERAVAADRWHAAGATIPVVVGRNGLAWGIGLHGSPADRGVPVKREGDGKAPAGLFELGPAFGYAPATSVPWIRLPYIQSAATLRCVDDSASRHYNTLVSEGSVGKDWRSSEEMLRPDEVYRLGMVIHHNWAEQTVAGKGSCIFMHIWEGNAIGTSGCTAMASSDLELLLRWLDPDAHPLLLQAPESEIRSFTDTVQPFAEGARQ